MLNQLTSWRRVRINGKEEALRFRRSGSAPATVLGAAMLWVATFGAPLAGAATGGGECQLEGVANLSPPLSSTAGNFTYNFTGDLGSGPMGACQSNVPGAPTTGTVSAGIQLSETVPLTRPGVCTAGRCDNGVTACVNSSQCPAVVITGTVLYQEPIPQGGGSCGSSTTAGEALTTWSDGKHTVAVYNTTGALAGVVLQGTVAASMSLTLVASSVPAGYTAPPTYMINSDEPAFAVGDGVLAALTFSPTTPDQDCVTTGVSSADINGVIGIGSAQ
jgi:hypothetical protein